jgi:lactoylglutathione lyase
MTSRRAGAPPGCAYERRDTVKLTHIRLLVRDYGACFRFYRDVMGFEPVWGDESSGYADLDAGNATLALFGRGEMAKVVGTGELPAEALAQDTAVLIFAVEDVDAATARLQERRVPLVAAPADRPEWGVRTAHFRDPDGNLIEINAPLPEDESGES